MIDFIRYACAFACIALIGLSARLSLLGIRDRARPLVAHTVGFTLFAFGAVGELVSRVGEPFDWRVAAYPIAIVCVVVGKLWMLRAAFGARGEVNS